MAPGIYMLDGAGFQVSGNANVECQGGVLLYVWGTGMVHLGGTGSVVLTPLDAPSNSADAIYNGVTIFQDRNDTQEAYLGGCSGFNLTGILYFPSNHVAVMGGSAATGNELIANTVTLGGNGTIKINYTGRFTAPVQVALIR